MGLMKRHVYYLPLATLLVVVVLVGWAAYKQLGQGKGEGASAKTAIAQGCADLLTLVDFRRVCPFSSNTEGLRAMSHTDYFKDLYKCSISISGSDAVTFYAVVDVFQDPQSALDRMIDRTYNRAGNEGRGKLNDFVSKFGNVLGLGEISAIYNFFNVPILLLQKEHVYAEVMSTGGELCPKSEFFELGRFIYGRMSELKAYPR